MLVGAGIPPQAWAPEHLSWWRDTWEEGLVDRWPGLLMNQWRVLQTVTTNNCPSPQGPEAESVLAGTRGAVRQRLSLSRYLGRVWNLCWHLDLWFQLWGAGDNTLPFFCRVWCLLFQRPHELRQVSTVLFPGTRCLRGEPLERASRGGTSRAVPRWCKFSGLFMRRWSRLWFVVGSAERTEVGLICILCVAHTIWQTQGFIHSKVAEPILQSQVPASMPLSVVLRT